LEMGRDLDHRIVMNNFTLIPLDKRFIYMYSMYT
jgi:hypothetical protein